MESLSKPPHRRKHSSVTNAFSTSFSMKNPYDNVLLSNGGKKTKAFGDGEYAEIFSGSSSIPVLDLSGLDERVGSGDRRSSGKLDYSNIFGGFRNDDVVLPYEELVNGSAKKTKQRFPADDRPPLQESGSLHSSAKTKRFSGEASDKSSDEAKQQFNISFNKTSQINNDPLNGKTHVAQLHAVPEFTYFVDGASQLQKKEDDKPVRSLKREVSRTWSFSAEVEAVKGKDRTNWDNKSRTPDKLHNVNEINLKLHPSKVLPPSKISSYVSKEDATEKLSGEYSPPLLDEEWDENSVAAVSAAALKKALEQAQETINIAKMIMEGKKVGFQDGTKPKGRSKVNITKKKMMNCGSEENKARENYERLDPIFPKFSGIDGKFAPKVEVERVWENVDAAKDLGETSIGVDKQFYQSCSETHYNAEKVELEKQGETVGVRREATDITGLVASAEYKAVNLLSGLVDNIKNLMLSKNKPGSSLEEMETGKKTSEMGEVTLHDTKGPEIAAQLTEIDLRNPKRTQELEMSATETLGQCQGNVDHSTGPENVIELVEEVPIDSRVTQEQEKIVNEGGENLTKVKEDEMIVDGDLATDYKVKLDVKFQASGKMVNPAHVKVLDELRDQVNKELVEQEEMKKKSENIPDGKENGHELEKSVHENCNGKWQTEDHQSVESDEQLNEVSKAEINERTPEVFPEISVVQTEVNVTNDLEMDDKKNNHVHDGDERNFSVEHDQIEATEMNSFEYKAAETIEMEAERTVEDQNKCEFQEATYEKDIDEADDPIFTETQEACVFYLNNKAEGYQTEFESYKNKVGVPRVDETSSNIDEDKDAEELFDLGDIEMPGIDSLSTHGSEEDTVGGKFQNSDESDSSDGKQENFGVTDADIEENIPKDEDTSETSSEIHDDTKEYAAEIHWEISPEFCPDYKTAEFSQSSESDKESESMSNLENIEELTANESRECGENAKNETSNKDEVNEDVEMTSKSNSVCSEQQSEEVHLEKSMETEKDTETSQNIEKNKENLTETSMMKEKDGEENAQDFDRDDHQKRIEAIKKGREREKDRIAVERAIREARERAFVEARERAERAAVERAAAEARQRTMAEAREKLDKASMEAKIRTERAAVERATTEARARALEKAVSQKTSTDSKTQTEKYSTERFASSSRNGLKHSFSSPDLEKLDGANSESVQRRKARLERHQRIMERASKALEEKNMRDLVAQKEQAERNRLAESLDADIKRWATGKEGNLRALLSTLQYILGADSGWQPISLTEIIATAAVKKAYRKATLCVHPDKLQQRGASIRQKYICEKVFDLLKAAWNRFNSEER